jgi:hypothetical protein
MFASGAAYNKAFSPCIEGNRISPDVPDHEWKSMLEQRVMDGISIGAMPVTHRWMTGISLGAVVAGDHICRANYDRRGPGGDSVPSTNVEPTRSVSAPPLSPVGIASLSDEECMERLAHAVEEHDSRHLDELAQLLGRLAVVIE